MTAHPSGKSDLPRLPAELLGSVPRDVRLTVGGFVVAAVAIAIAIGAPVAAIFMSIAGSPVWTIPLTVLSLFATAAAIARSVRRQWMLLSEGRAAQARVTDVKRVHKDKRKAYRVSYEFQTISGATQASRCEIGKAPPVGAVIPIVYHRDKPEWTAAYPLQLVRPGRLVS
jgi:hypothetical protein